MVESRCTNALKIWAGLAWSDQLSEKEEAVLNRLLESAPALSPEERATGQSFLQSRVDDKQTMAAASELSGLEFELRRDIYRVAALIAMVDPKATKVETDLLARLRLGLKLPDDVAAYS